MAGISPLSSMISTAVKMQVVRRDANLNQAEKDQLLAKLQKSNDGIVQISETQSDAADKGNAVGASAAGGETGGTAAPSMPLGSKGSIVSKLA
ncbi:MAG: hypothetical protein Q7T68_12520 [Sphingopyxis sp.]|nr:hypothetical protein [Sphingopyxis sp.]